MTSAEISAMREQVTELYKKAWSEWDKAVDFKSETERQEGEACTKFDNADYFCDRWDCTKDYLMNAISQLLQLQCYAATREQEGLQ